MRKEPKSREQRRWWEVSDTIKVALIGAVAIVGTAFWTTHATQDAQDSAQRAALEQQRLSFQQQQALTDRDELRKVLDEAAATLDTVISELDKMGNIWIRGPRRPPSSDEFEVAVDRWNQMTLRLAIRLSSGSDVVRNFKAAGMTAHDIGFAIASFRPTRDRLSKVRSRREKALDHQDAFTNAARQLLNP
jgi:hypothetical protein